MPALRPSFASRWRRLGRDESGSVTLFFVVASLALFAMLGLVVDGTTKIRALQQADGAAEEAARAAGQVINLPDAVRGGPAVADPDRAVQAARDYLHAADLTGTIRLEDGGRAIAVDVPVTRPTVFLGLLGVDQLHVTGHARARLVRSVTGQEAP